MSAPVVVGIHAESNASLAYGAAEAMRLGAPLRLVHAVAPDLLGPGGAGWQQLNRAAEQVCRWTCGRVELETMLVMKAPAEALVAAARGARLVVVERPPAPGAGRKGAPPAAGSVTAALALRARVPFVVVPSGWSSPVDVLPLRLHLADVDGWSEAARSRVAVADRPVLVHHDDLAGSWVSAN